MTTEARALTGAPFLVVGCGRSGTSLLRAMLDSHPGIFMPAETFFFVSVAPRISLDPASEPARVADAIASYWWVRDMGVTGEAIMAEVSEPHPSWLHMFRSLVRAAAGVAGASDRLLGEKTPRHVQSAEWYVDATADGKVVQILRDPRAVLASFRKVPIGTNAAALVADEWPRAVDVHRRLDGHPRYVALRYEDLVADPEREIARVLDFLGLDPHAAVLEFQNRARTGFSERQTHHRATLQPLFAKRVDAWRDELPATSVRVLETVVDASRMEGVGYAPEHGQRPAGALQVTLSRLVGATHRATVLRFRQAMKRLR